MKVSRTGAFSLVEVVLAIGIISFALIVVITLFGSLIGRYGEVRDKRDVLAAVNALAPYLAEEQSFASVYSQASQGNMDFIFTQYRVNEFGTPDASGKRLISQWFSNTNPPGADVDSTREGRWIMARVEVDPALNPIPAPLPSSPDQYPDSRLVLTSKLYVVPTPSFTISTNDRALITVPVVVNR